MKKPPPLVARELRFGIPERLDGRGNVLLPLDEAAVRRWRRSSRPPASRAIAIGFMHAYLDGKHERRTRDILAEALPDVPISLVERSLAGDPRVRALVDGAAPTPMSSR